MSEPSQFKGILDEIVTELSIQEEQQKSQMLAKRVIPQQRVSSQHRPATIQNADRIAESTGKPFRDGGAIRVTSLVFLMTIDPLSLLPIWI